MLANRVSWFYDFKGASMNLDSACSSSLSALHLACEDLRNGTSNMVSHANVSSRIFNLTLVSSH
jgi:acyl transferase domain-containing protein